MRLHPADREVEEDGLLDPRVRGPLAALVGRIGGRRRDAELAPIELRDRPLDGRGVAASFSSARSANAASTSARSSVVVDRAMAASAGDGRDLARGEEVRDLDRRVLERVGAVDGVLADVARRRALRIVPGVGLRRIGRAHDLAVLRDGVLALEHADEDGRTRHELDELAEERTRLVDGVEALGDLTRQLHALARDDREAGLLEHGEDRACAASSRRRRA